MIDLDLLPQLARYNKKERRRIWKKLHRKHAYRPASLLIAMLVAALGGLIMIWLSHYCKGGELRLIKVVVAVLVAIMHGSMLTALNEQRVVDDLHKKSPEQLDEMAERNTDVSPVNAVEKA